MQNKDELEINEQTPIDCSVVIPVYFNEGSLESTMDCLVMKVFNENPDYLFEVIFVDDGSGDDSLEELLRIQQTNSHSVKVIKFTRNFGQVSAITAGFDLSKGRCVVVISADGQDPPELINEMLAIFRSGTEIVIATREEREESKFRILSSRFFYEAIRKLSFKQMPSGGFDYFLLGRRSLDAILDNKEAQPFLQGQILWTGYPMKVLTYARKKREIGVSRWSFGKKLTYLLDGVLSYSYFPIRVISAIGGLVSLAGFVYAFVIFVDWFIWGNPITGWAPIMIVILMVSGFQLAMLGIIGEYLWRTLAQVRQREAYLVETIYEQR